MGCSLELQSLGYVLLICHPTPLSKPVQAAKPHKTAGSNLALGCFFWAGFPGLLTRGASGQTWGVAAAPLGWVPAGAGLQGDMGIAAAPCRWAATLAGHTPLASFSGGGGASAAPRDGVRGREPLPGERAGFQLRGCGAANVGAWKSCWQPGTSNCSSANDWWCGFGQLPWLSLSQLPCQ